MRYLTILFIFMCFTVIVYSRPSQKDQGNQRVIEEAEYEIDPKDGVEEQESYARQEESVDEEPEEHRRYSDNKKNPYLSKNFEKDRSGYSNVDLLGYKPSKSKDERETISDDESNVFEGFQFYPKHRLSTKYVQGNDASETQQNKRNNVNNFKSNHNSILTVDTPNQRTAQDSKMALNEEGDILFESKDQTEKVDKSDYSNEPLDSNHRYSKQYYSVIHSDNKAMPDSKGHENERLYSNRERRNIDSNQPNTDNLTDLGAKKMDSDASNTEDSEMAIKRHILKLSSDELQELLNSLSDEKRTLLKKIIDDTKLVDTDSVHKREITKKAEAIEENGYIESGQLEAGKIQAGNVAVTESAIGTSIEVASNNKQQDIKTDGTDLGNTKNVDTTADMKTAINFQLNSDSVAPQKSDDSMSSCANIDAVDKSEIVSSEPVTLKNENKREANPKELSDVSETELSDSCPQDEELSQLTDEDQSQFDEENKTYKRDVEQQAELDSKMKSLEESFPNSDAYDESPGPLIRVKRKNAEVVMKKRSAALLPDAKVAFFPYRSESDDDDNEEGNEFDDEGFYERAHICNKNIEEDSTLKRKFNNLHVNNKEQQTSLSDLKKSAQIGTDTDNVLSGVEGVDENLMFSSGSRSRRTTEDNHLSDNADESNSQSLNSKTLDELTKSLSEGRANNVPNYQENDAFGPLPRNYDGDLGRYKRIRRVKQSHEEEPQSNT